jgi:uncharacterized coiled-coil protein SlyX
MFDAFTSQPRKDSATATRHSHGRLMVGALAALLIVAGAFVWRLASGPPPTIAALTAKAAAPATNSATNPVLDQLVEATRALEVSQQQAIDQLQELQQLLTTQQAEARKSSGEVAALSDKLEALRQSFASAPTSSPEAADEPSPRKPKHAARHSRGKMHRVVSVRARTAAARR